jgi:hypothetical protein
MVVVNSVISWFMRKRYETKVQYLIHQAVDAQNNLFQKLILHGTPTQWGSQYGYSHIKNIQQYQQQVPLNDYDTLKPYIQRMMLGESNVLWQGQTKWFSKSSGTTNDVSKYIPVTNANLHACHLKGGFDVMSAYYTCHPDAGIFNGKNMIMGGTHQIFDKNPETRIGDVSAIMIEHMPPYVKLFNTPDLETVLMSEWESKIERMATIGARENVTTIGGVPTWTTVLFKRMLEVTGKKNMHEIWPNFELYMHGGVNFEPYAAQFQTFFPNRKVNYLNIYNASEGFFAAQLEENDDRSMHLLTDNGVFFEFIPVEEWGQPQPNVLWLDQVEAHKNYILVISTNAGLWRYIPGDTVRFTSIKPFKIIISGRTKFFINVFGEEVTVENTDKAIAQTCSELRCLVKEYTVAPIFMTDTANGGHEWLVEFSIKPHSTDEFAKRLDENLQAINSDYQAKRYKDIALRPLVLHDLPDATFYNWLRSKGKYGGQHKVPRLLNDRSVVDSILPMIQTS